MLKKIFKWTGRIVLVLLLIICGIAAYIKFAMPNVGEAPELKIKADETKIERGRYLANNVMACMDCHTPRDVTKFTAPIFTDSLGAGSDEFNRKVGFPGNFEPKNLTPFHLKDWTDGELFRAITTGVNKDGKAMFPIMPYSHYGKMDKEDIYAVIAYLRTLSPISRNSTVSDADFPMNFIMNTIPQKADFSTAPDTSNIVEYGKYLVNAAACVDCHTKQVQGKMDENKLFAGDMEFDLPGGIVHSANITPDETGIKKWDKATFIHHFKMYADSGYQPVTVKPTDFNTPMPWTAYGKMKESDIAAIYAYLRTVKPVANSVTKFVAKK